MNPNYDANFFGLSQVFYALGCNLYCREPSSLLEVRITFAYDEDAAWNRAALKELVDQQRICRSLVLVELGDDGGFFGRLERSEWWFCLFVFLFGWKSLVSWIFEWFSEQQIPVYQFWVVATQLFFGICTLKIGEDEPKLTNIFCQIGWFNHQPVYFLCVCVFVVVGNHELHVWHVLLVLFRCFHPNGNRAAKYHGSKGM